MTYSSYRYWARGVRGRMRDEMWVEREERKEGGWGREGKGKVLKGSGVSIILDALL